MLSILVWAAMPADAGSSAAAVRKWSKKHDVVLRLGKNAHDPVYWRHANRKDETVYFSEWRDEKEVRTATPYTHLERIPASYGIYGVWAHRSDAFSCRTRVGLTKGMGARHEEGLDCSLDWLGPDGSLIKRFDHLEGLWLNFGDIEVVNGIDMVHPAVVAMVQRDGDDRWFQFVNVETQQVTTPWLPEIVFVGDETWEMAAIPLPSGEVWPIGSDGNRVGERRSIAGYTPILTDEGGLFGWVVRHDTGEDEALLGLADERGDEIVEPSLASFELLDDGWCVMTDPEGRFRSHPLAFVDAAIDWEPTLDAAKARGREAVAEREARLQAIVRAKAAEKAEIKARHARFQAELRAQQRALEERADALQNTWCQTVVDDVGRGRALSLSDLDTAVRICDDRLDADGVRRLSAARQAILDRPAPAPSAPKRFSFAQMLVAVGTQPQPYRSGSSAYTGSSSTFSNSDLQAIRDRAAVERNDARFDQFIDYVSGSSSYDPSPVYRYNR